MLLDPRQIYEIWAPPQSVWSQWAKPVLFVTGSKGPLGFSPVDILKTTLPVASQMIPPDWPDSWLHGEHCAIIADLPGELSPLIGLVLARRGFRPIPLYNGAWGSQNATVDVSNLLCILREGAEELRETPLSAQAPPAFLLDYNRIVLSSKTPGRFDNRWVVFPQDFPSGAFLKSQGISRALLIQRGTSCAQSDLAHVLVRWREAGIELFVADIGAPVPVAQTLSVSRPSRFRSLWHRLLALSGLITNSAGGFGGVVPEPSSSSSSHYG